MSDQKKIKKVIDVVENYLNESGEISQLKDIIDEFSNLLEHEEKQNTALITTAFPLSETQKKQIIKVLTSIYKQKLDFEYRQDENMLAGIKIQIYDQVIDLSLESSLQNISQKLKQ